MEEATSLLNSARIPITRADTKEEDDAELIRTLDPSDYREARQKVYIPLHAA